MEQWIPPTPVEIEEIRRAEEIAQRAADQGEAEKRENVRLAMHANVSLHSETNFFTGFTENISEGGVFVATMSPPGEGERVHLKITVEGSAGVYCEGEVRWIRTDDTGCFTGCGIEFVDLSAEATVAIETMFKNTRRVPLLNDF